MPHRIPDNWYQGPFDENLLKLVPEETIRKWNVFPVEVGEGELLLATSEELDLDSRETLEFLLGRDLIFMKVAYETFQQALQNSGYGGISLEAREPKVSFQASFSEQSSASEYFKRLLSAAISKGATDIHVEAKLSGGLIRLRVEGCLVEQERVEIFLETLVQYVKVLAEMNIDEKRLPQDGSFRFNFEGEELDFRVSSLPSVHGESLAIRILNHDAGQTDLSELGLTAEDVKSLDDITSQSSGLVLFSGPTGSGKTTTMYALARQLVEANRKIVSVEDPIEQNLPGVNQIEVNYKASVTFSSALRSTLRQAPDVIMIGEIRDSETAEIAVNAALTGHLVLASVHSLSSFCSIVRMKNLGVQSLQLSSALLGIISQRLLPKKSEKGRIGVFEIIKLNDEIWELINGDSVQASEFFSAYPHSLKNAGLKKAEMGLVDFDSLASMLSLDLVNN